jgi:hypothetical protein
LSSLKPATRHPENSPFFATPVWHGNGAEKNGLAYPKAESSGALLTLGKIIREECISLKELFQLLFS